MDLELIHCVLRAKLRQRSKRLFITAKRREILDFVAEVRGRTMTFKTLIK